MSSVEEYAKKTVEELNKLLHKWKDELEELEEEQQFVLGQTGYHLPGATVKKYAAEIQSLKDRIEAGQIALEQKKVS